MNNFMFDNMNQSFSTFNIMFIVVSIIIGLSFIFVILSMVSPKFRGKMMSRQIKATKHMVNYSKEDLKDISNTAINIKKNILDENEETLKEMSDMEADIKKDYVKTMAKSVKEGLSEDSIYCKHCGTIIDSDSKFCKKCGKEQ